MSVMLRVKYRATVSGIHSCMLEPSVADVSSWPFTW